VSYKFVFLLQTNYIDMILESAIAHVVEQQKIRISLRDTGLKRELVPAVKSLSSHALIISGIGVVGKAHF